MQNSRAKSMTNNKIYSSYVEETNDGTGDGILTIPDEIIEEMGWKEGTVLKLTVEETPTGNILIMTEAVANTQHTA
jgi:hypothetical protein